MIDRYILHNVKQQLIKNHNIDEAIDFNSTFNAIPTNKLPIITNKSKIRLESVHWGQTPEWSNDKKLSIKLFNAFSEEFRTKSSLKKALQENRCLIPATGFVYWNKVGKKTAIPYLYHLKNFESFTIAGIWENYSSITDSSENEHNYIIFKMITTNHPTLRIQTPLVMEESMENSWLQHNEIEELESLLSTKSFDSYSISPIIKGQQSDDEESLKHVPPVDQSGNYTLFG